MLTSLKEMYQLYISNCIKMFIQIAIILGVLGQFSRGVPLESPTSDYSHFFESRIVGGTDAAEGLAPHMAGMIVGQVFKSLTCGGSIISRRHVLTAAHCITSYIMGDGNLMDSLHIVIGSNSWESGTAVLILGYCIHPQYDAWNIKHDIGILTTDRITLVKDRVAVIPLHFEFVGGGRKGFVTGWGTQRLWGPVAAKLQVLYVSTLSHQQCVDRIAAILEAWGDQPPPVEELAEICTFHSPGHGMCHGDSGSALVLIVHKRSVQVGIVSWGFPCAIGAPDMFVRVGSYRKWILDCMGRDKILLESDNLLEADNLLDTHNLLESDHHFDAENVLELKNLNSGNRLEEFANMCLSTKVA